MHTSGAARRETELLLHSLDKIQECGAVSGQGSVVTAESSCAAGLGSTGTGVHHRTQAVWQQPVSGEPQKPAVSFWKLNMLYKDRRSLTKWLYSGIAHSPQQ